MSTELEEYVKYWVDVLPDINVRRYSSVSACALFAYDIILSWNEEYQHIWKPKWSYSTVLYFLSRYPWFITSIMVVYLYTGYDPPRWVCEKTVTFQLYSAIIHIAFVQFILAIRTYAIYDRNKWILIVLCFLIACGNGFDFWLVASTLPQIVSTVPPSPFVPGCFQGCDHCSRLTQWFWVPLGLLEMTICCLTVFRAYQHSKSRLYHTPILHTLYRDGFLYFAVIFTFEIANFLVWKFARQSLAQSSTPFLGTVNGIMCPRLLLNLKATRLTGSSHPISSYTDNIMLTTVQFQQPGGHSPTGRIEAKD